MRRVLLPASDLTLPLVVIGNEKAHYLFTVLRCRPGELLTIIDDQGNAYSSRILSASKRELSVELLGKEALETESPLRTVLVQSLLKGEKMDLVIQKATELGVSEIRPVVSSRSQVRTTGKTPRWRKIAGEAARQSGRSRLPEIHDPVIIDEIFGGSRAADSGRIIFWEQGGEALSDIVSRMRGKTSVTLLTGPEGGFSEEEVMKATECGFVPATLGRRILRAETAALAALSVIQFSLGDLGN